MYTHNICIIYIYIHPLAWLVIWCGKNASYTIRIPLVGHQRMLPLDTFLAFAHRCLDHRNVQVKLGCVSKLLINTKSRDHPERMFFWASGDATTRSWIPVMGNCGVHSSKNYLTLRKKRCRSITKPWSLGIIPCKNIQNRFAQENTYWSQSLEYGTGINLSSLSSCLHGKQRVSQSSTAWGPWISAFLLGLAHWNVDFGHRSAELGRFWRQSCISSKSRAFERIFSHGSITGV